jgi:hypothetical protein
MRVDTLNGLMGIRHDTKSAGRHVSVQTPPPNPIPQGEGEPHNLLFRKTPSPLVGEGWGGGCERLRRHIA